MMMVDGVVVDDDDVDAEADVNDCVDAAVADSVFIDDGVDDADEDVDDAPFL